MKYYNLLPWKSATMGLRGRVKIELFSREGQIFPGERILIFSPDIVKYRKLLCVKLLFSCKLSKTDLQPHFGTFPEGSTTAPGGRIPNPPSIFTLLRGRFRTIYS